MMMDYSLIKKKASAKSALPDGWGRSVVGGREIITKPSQVAESVSLQPTYPEKQPFTYEPLSLNGSEGFVTDRDMARFAQDNEETSLRSMISDEFRPEDLMNQWNTLGGDDSEENRLANDILLQDLDDLENGSYVSKYLKNGKKYSLEEEEEAVRFQGNAVKYGRNRSR